MLSYAIRGMEGERFLLAACEHLHPRSLTVKAKCAQCLESKAAIVLDSTCMFSFIHNSHVGSMNNDVTHV